MPEVIYGELDATNEMSAEKEKMRSMNVATRTRSKGFCGAGTTMANSMPCRRHGEEMRSTSVSACGYVQKNQRFTRSGNLYGEFSDPERQFMVSKDILNPQPVEDLKCQDHVCHGEKTELATNPSQYSMIRQAPLPACAMRSTAPCAAKRLSPQVFPP